MNKESEAYKSGEFYDIFNEAELENMAAEDVVAYSESKLRYEDDLAALDYNYNKGKAEGRAEGREEERIYSIRLMLSMGISPEVIAEKYSMQLKEVLEILK